jgi:hypothetical protein
VSGQRIPDGAEPSHADATTTRSAPSSALKTSLMPNDSDYGLASYVWSNDIRKSTKIANAMESGNVFINSYGYQSEIPFGGYKMSGIGREHGAEAIHEYSQAKSITVGLERFKSRFEV